MSVILKAFRRDGGVRPPDVLGADAGVIPEAVRGLGGGPIAGGDGDAGLGRVGQVVDRFDQAFIRASVPGRPGGVRVLTT